MIVYHRHWSSLKEFIVLNNSDLGTTYIELCTFVVSFESERSVKQEDGCIECMKVSVVYNKVYE